MKRRNVQRRGHIHAVPSEEEHGSPIILRAVGQLGDEIGLLRGVYQALNLVLVVWWQGAQAIDALVGVRGGEESEHDMERRQQPRADAVADEIASQRLDRDGPIAADVVKAA